MKFEIKMCPSMHTPFNKLDKRKLAVQSDSRLSVRNAVPSGFV